MASFSTHLKNSLRDENQPEVQALQDAMVAARLMAVHTRQKGGGNAFQVGEAVSVSGGERADRIQELVAKVWGASED